MMTLPLPQGVSLPLLHGSLNCHICPHFTALHTSSLPHFKHFGSTQLPACSVFLPSFDFHQLQEKKIIHKPMCVMRCVWHIMLQPSVHLSLPIFSFPKRSDIGAKSTQSSKPNPADKEHMEVPLGPTASFFTDNQRGCCWAPTLLWQESCTPAFNSIFNLQEIKT